MRLNRNLGVKEVPAFSHILRDLEATNTALQSIRPAMLRRHQPHIHELTEVYINYSGGWKPIQVTNHDVCMVLRSMYVYLKTWKRIGRRPGRIHFFPGRPIRYLENSLEAARAAAVISKAESDGTMALIKSLPECYATTHTPTHPLFTTYPSLPFTYMRTKNIVHLAPIALPPPVISAPVALPPPPPPTAANSDLSSSEGVSLSATFESPRVASRPPASPDTVERFLEEVSEEIQRRVRDQEEFWPDEGNRNSILLVPGNLRRSTQLISEGESGKYKPNKKEEFRMATKSVLTRKESSPSSKEGTSSINLTLSPLALEYPSSSVLDEREALHVVINGKVPGYSLRPYNTKSGKAPELESLPVWFYPVNALLLEHGVLLTSEKNAAVIQAWINVIPRHIFSAMALLHHCIANNVSFKLAIPTSALMTFQKPLEVYSARDRVATDVPFTPGFYESQLSDERGSALLNASYRLKAAEVAARLNMGAAVARGGSIGWIIKKLAGKEAILKLLDGPSYMASHLFNVDVLPTNPGSKEALMTESLTVGEELALVGFVPGCARKGPQMLFPMPNLMGRLLPGDEDGWNELTEALMNLRWDSVLKGEADTMTEDEWRTYIDKFYTKRAPNSMYEFSETDSRYGIDLMTMAYPTNWTSIRLSDMTFPEKYQGPDKYFEAL
ncbi:uncharacterized protein ARMOST_09952 [Armillaria ostoyae]|uniref:Uncharacterized protein n=1 Tax=Armillaria ostoyae TaxID=47428 RepID=A0A284RCZ2_ARMOS|nr:uncharacterized protein ARMOST_09952 [Armillaria ostoyae]